MANDSFPKLTRWLKDRKKVDIRRILRKYGEIGVTELAKATPKDTGLTSRSWRYEIVEENGQTKLQFLNSNIQDGTNVAYIIQVGHATARGFWIAGRDYINPALGPVVEKLTEEVWSEVSGS